MRTNIDISDDLMDEAIRVSGDPTKRAVVARPLRLLIATHGQGEVRKLKGTVAWQGDLAESRRGRAVRI